MLGGRLGCTVCKREGRSTNISCHWRIFPLSGGCQTTCGVTEGVCGYTLFCAEIHLFLPPFSQHAFRCLPWKQTEAPPALAKAPPYSRNSSQPLALRESLRFSRRPGRGDRKMNIHAQRATADERTRLRLSGLFSHFYGCVIKTVDRTLPMVHRVLSINKM